MLVALILVQTTVSGCRSCHDQCDDDGCGHHYGHDFLGIDKCSTIPQGAIPVPSGTYLDEWQNTQASIAEADKFMFYRNEWLDDGTELGPAGERHLAEIIPRIGMDPYNVVIEPSQDAAKDNRRKWNMIAWLSDRGITGAENLVLLGHPMYVEGLIGEEAEAIHDQMISDRVGTGTGRTGNFGTGSQLGGLGGLGGGFGNGFGGIGFRR